MKKMIKVLLVGLSFVSANVFAATVSGTLNVGGVYTATNSDDGIALSLFDVTGISLDTVFANPSTGDISGTIGIDTLPGTGGNLLSLDDFVPVTNFFTVAGWQLDVDSVVLPPDDQTAALLTLMGKGMLSGNDFDATEVTWSFSSTSTTSYSMSITSVMSPVPVPAAVWLFGSGILGLVGIARRKV